MSRSLQMVFASALNICRERCRSDDFILIDEYKEIPGHVRVGRGDVRTQYGLLAWKAIFKKHP